MDDMRCLPGQGLDVMRSLATEMKRLGIDHPDTGFVSAFTRGLSGNEKSRLRSMFRAELERRQRVCQLTGSRINLKASHIKPFDHCVSEEEAVCNANGLFLRGDIDYLFDGGFISFDDKRRLIISHEIVRPLGKLWPAQMQIAIGEQALHHWATGGDKCKVKAYPIPRKMDFPKGSWSDRDQRRRRKPAIEAARMREEFMDYHRRHVFKGPEVQAND